jgi:hypothetical protein
MKLRIGDRVSFLNEKGGGIITGLRPPDTVLVTMEDGLEIPYEEDQLVLVQRELLRGSREGVGAPVNTRETGKSVYLVIEGFEEGTPDFRIHLVNATHYTLAFSYSVTEEENCALISSGEAGPFQRLLLRKVKPEYFREYPEHRFECLFFGRGSFQPHSPLSVLLKINEKILEKTQRISHNGFGGPVAVFMVDEMKDNAADPYYSLQSSKPEKPAVSIKKKERLEEKEVDLHIEELVDNLRGLSNHQILKIQLDRFEMELDAAIANGLKKITFIHGVGNGRLKQEILAILKNTEGIEFYDAAYRKYGFGATEVKIF